MLCAHLCVEIADFTFLFYFVTMSNTKTQYCMVTEVDKNESLEPKTTNYLMTLLSCTKVMVF